MNQTETLTFGSLLRDWRRRRHLSQLDLACDSNISTRHLSFIETGRSIPSREMVIHLAEHLDIPLRERNSMLIAAGYAPVYKERSLSDPSLEAARKVVDLILRGHEPYPALAIDRHWNLMAANRAVAPFLKAVDSSLLTPTVNVLRLSLHPLGLAPRILNLGEWRSHLLARLRHQIDVTADPVLETLLQELSSYPFNENQSLKSTSMDYAGVAVPLQFESEHGTLSFLSTTTVFGTPVDITLSELALETFFPADATTAEILKGTIG